LARSAPSRSASPRHPRASARSKRDDILAIAAEHFGRAGYEDTKWADVAADVGIGSTALYHYFESKLHCLFEVMSESLLELQAVFEEVTREHERFEDGLVALLQANFELSDAAVLRRRILVAEQGRLSQPRNAERGEEARRRALARVGEREVAWSNYLSRGMAIGAIPEADPSLLARAVLGLYDSIWHWFTPRGTLSLTHVASFYLPRIVGLVGLDSVQIADGFERPRASQPATLSGAARSPRPAPPARAPSTSSRIAAK
jgi:AcrR family transcriptional regulator